MSTSTAAKMIDWPTLITSVILMLITNGVASLSLLNTLDKRQEVQETKQSFYVESVTDLKKNLKDSQEKTEKQLERVSTAVDDIKSALLTNRKLDELKTLMIGAGIGKGQVDKLLGEGK